MKADKKCRTLEECLNEWLQNPENRDAYFDATVEEYLEDHDFDFFIKALRKIATAKNSVLREEAEIDKNNLNRFLEKNPKPTLENVLQVLAYSLVLDIPNPLPS